MAGREPASLHGAVAGTVIVDSDQGANYVQTVWMPAQHLGQFFHRRAPRQGPSGSRRSAVGAERPRVTVI